ncbi:Hypothetical_protein [Hexamita inflata]|uniref:Hypothetical_protein n=1 Tax=Hexamita inflata TaxID=28002 RepID=A0AA86NG92_9EUKA|nr:Hypothetical protein HINF_LOCUS6715 [Hexamita inflata]
MYIPPANNQTHKRDQTFQYTQKWSKRSTLRFRVKSTTQSRKTNSRKHFKRLKLIQIKRAKVRPERILNILKNLGNNNLQNCFRHHEKLNQKLFSDHLNMLTLKQKIQKLLTPQKNLMHQNLVGLVVSQTKLLKNQLTMVGLSRYQQAHLKL